MDAAGKSEDFLNNEAGAGQFSRATQRRPSAIQISMNDGDVKPNDKKDIQRSEFSVAPSGKIACREDMNSTGKGYGDGQANQKGRMQSMHSVGSNSSAAAAHGKELVETLYYKLKGIKWNLFSIINNIVLLIILTELYTEKGLFFNIGPYLFIHA
jgi:hypothetical protein